MCTHYRNFVTVEGVNGNCWEQTKNIVVVLYNYSFLCLMSPTNVVSFIYSYQEIIILIVCVYRIKISFDSATDNDNHLWLIAHTHKIRGYKTIYLYYTHNQLFLLLELK